VCPKEPLPNGRGPLIPQSHHRIHLSRPPRRYVTRRQRHPDHGQRHSHKRPRIEGARAEQQPPHKPRQRRRPRRSQHRPCQPQLQSLAQDHLQHIARLRAHGHPYPKITLPSWPTGVIHVSL
jgi:hypothetical protein